MDPGRRVADREVLASASGTTLRYAVVLVLLECWAHILSCVLRALETRILRSALNAYGDRLCRPAGKVVDCGASAKRLFANLRRRH